MAAVHPRLRGARCDLCSAPKLLEEAGEAFSPDTIVQGCSPVPSELKASAWFTVVGEAPGKDEVKCSQPMVGRSGMRLTADLASLGVPRHQWNVLNVINCHPPGDDLKGLLRKAKKRGLPSPVECCRPRLNAELASVGQAGTKIIAVGGLAAKALMKIPKGILTVRGGPVELERGFVEAAGSVEVVESEDEDGEVVESLDLSAAPRSFRAATPGDPLGLIKILPTVHPAFVLRANRWGPIFLSDLGRAIRFFLGKMAWTEPAIHVRPTADALYAWLNRGDGRAVRAAPQPFWGVDTETEWGDPLTIDLRTVQIATHDTAVVIPFYSIEENRYGQRFYDEAEERRVKDVLRWFLLSKDHVKTGHNFAYFDRLVLERHLGVRPVPVIDGLILHRMVAPELPHGLGVVGSIYTDAPSWKQDADGLALSTNARTDAQLHLYGGTDAVISNQILPPMLIEAGRRADEVAAAFGATPGGLSTPCPGLPGWTLSQVDHFAQSMCVGLHKVGMYIDQAERLRLIDVYEAKAAEKLTEVRALAKEIGATHFDPDVVDAGSFGLGRGSLFGVAPWTGDAGETRESEEESKGAARKAGDLNPGSADQLRDLLYGKWHLVPVDTTDAGLPSTSSECLLEHIIDPTVPPQLVRFLEAVRLYRRYRNKYLGTYLYPFGTMDIDGSGKREERGRTKRGAETIKQVTAHCWPSDGRVRSVVNAHVANVGRLSVSHPGTQQIPQKMRSMFVPAPGHVFVEADYDQLHLRLIASLWGIARLLDCFRTGDDPHLLLGVDLFGDRLTKADGWVDVRTKPKGGTTAARIRDNNKTMRYTFAYWASIATGFKTMLKAEDRDGNLVNKGMTLREMTKLYEIYMRVEPEWQAAWEVQLALFLRYGFIADPILGRRNDFGDIVRSEFRAQEDQEKSAVVNFGILAAEVAVARLGEIELLEAIPYSVKTDRSGWGTDLWGPGTGLIAQTHDAELLEVPVEQADFAAGVLRKAMNRTIPGLAVPFTSKPEVKMRWKDA